MAPEPGLPSVELRIGRPAKAKMLIGIGTGLGPAKGAPMLLSVLIPRKTLRVNFCIGKYCSYLSTERVWHFMHFDHPRGLPEAVGSWDAWRVCGPSSGR